MKQGESNWCLTTLKNSWHPHLTCAHTPKLQPVQAHWITLEQKKTMTGSMLRGHFLQRWGPRNHRCLVKRQVVLLLKEVRHQKNCCIAPGHRRDKGAETLRRGTLCMYKPQWSTPSLPTHQHASFPLASRRHQTGKAIWERKNGGDRSHYKNAVSKEPELESQKQWPSYPHWWCSQPPAVGKLPKDPLSVLYP